MTPQIALALMVLPVLPAHGVTLSFPGNAVETASVDLGQTRIGLPSGAWTGESVPLREGAGDVRQTAWQLRGRLSTPAQIVDSLREQLTDAGWTVVFTCADRDCGGYDFRFASNTLPAPQMFVDLGNFRYLLATKGDDALLSLMVSRGRDRAWVQLTEVSPEDADVQVDTTDGLFIGGGDLAASLERTGRAVLDDVQFDSGSSQLRDGPVDGLEDVAAYLRNHPSKTFAIVGHTDSDGGMEPNIALSRARARAVRQALIDRFDIPPAQIEARGIGYLAPLARNDTPEGRLANRRVEIVATN